MRTVAGEDIFVRLRYGSGRKKEVVREAEVEGVSVSVKEVNEEREDRVVGGRGQETRQRRLNADRRKNLHSVL
jgi:hypothetical protein